MICGVGVDIVELDRIAAAYDRFGHRFVERILTLQEQADCGDPPRIASLAARFAAKEAVAKALGVGISGIKWRDIEVVRRPSGEPAIALSGGAARVAARRGVKRVFVSLSHSRRYAVATATAEE